MSTRKPLCRVECYRSTWAMSSGSTTAICPFTKGDRERTCAALRLSVYITSALTIKLILLRESSLCKDHIFSSDVSNLCESSQTYWSSRETTVSGFYWLHLWQSWRGSIRTNRRWKVEEALPSPFSLSLIGVDACSSSCISFASGRRLETGTYLWCMPKAACISSNCSTRRYLRSLS